VHRKAAQGNEMCAAKERKEADACRSTEKKRKEACVDACCAVEERTEADACRSAEKRRKEADADACCATEEMKEADRDCSKYKCGISAQPKKGHIRQAQTCGTVAQGEQDVRPRSCSQGCAAPKAAGLKHSGMCSLCTTGSTTGSTHSASLLYADVC
jgi:hypothetical protein